MSNKHTRSQQETERIVLAHLRQRGGGWVTGREIACELGHSPKEICWSLLRLANGQRIEQRSMTWVSSRYRTRRCYQYRLVVELTATFPAWLVPPATAVAVGIGRVIRMEK